MTKLDHNVYFRLLSTMAPHSLLTTAIHGVALKLTVTLVVYT